MNTMFELEESYFGARRIRGKMGGRGVAGKTPVFGLLKFIKAIQNCFKKALMPVIQGKILEGSTIHPDGWSAYDWLIFTTACTIARTNLRVAKVT